MQNVQNADTNFSYLDGFWALDTTFHVFLNVKNTFYCVGKI